MANPEHLRIIKEGVKPWNKFWNQIRQRDPVAKADLFRADLRGRSLVGIDLSMADLINADLSGTDLRGANLVYAYMLGTRLKDANLFGASLDMANFVRADLNGTNFSTSRIANTTFVNVNLSVARGLDEVIHQGPSSISIDTIYRSKGDIPEVFLRGAGLPDSFISYARSLASSPIQFYSLFISHSSLDQEFTDRLYTDLQANGVRCWFAREDIKGGRKLHDQIDEAIRVYDRLLLILSEHSMNSEWVKTEIANARKRENRENRQMLFPISLVPFEKIKEWKAFDADTGKDSAREVREYFIPDFSNWKNHDSYQKAFERLLRDLKADRGEAKEA